MSRFLAIAGACFAVLGCSGAPDASTDSGADSAVGAAEAGGGDSGAVDAITPGTDAAADASAACFTSSGVWGDCMTLSACAALGDHVSTAGYCPGPSDIECCTKTPSVADNPPMPAGWKLMVQADVTPAMTSWAVAILHDPATYPMFSTTTQTFGSLLVMARVEWHPPDFQNSAVHRGVTLYEPI
ncbi:MAG TPA: hypothetical protein VLM85_05895 [Polyangiaceae bacterium]|nr:hypothetical protein [Polyangiaceae bacterium]